MPKKPQTNYQDMNDDELIELARNNVQEAEKTLIKRYQYLVQIKSNSYFIPGSDRKDVIQEGMIGLYKAIRDYKVDNRASFKSFASICIVRNIITAVKKAGRKKKQPLNSSVSLNKPLYNSESERSLFDIFSNKDSSDDPLDLFLHKQRYRLLKSQIKENFSELEYDVFQEYKKNKSYQEIAETLDISNKSVDNALQRIRNKIEKFLKENEYFND